LDRITSNRSKDERAGLGDDWYIDEVFVSIGGKQHYLWRAVDQDGDVLDVLLQQHCDQKVQNVSFDVY